jgi:hypothetical protein
MTRFVRSGKNWEGRSWVANPAIDALADQIESAWPERHAADGTVASKGHDAGNPSSDHRPYPYSGSGVVCAIDVGEVTEDDGFQLAEALRVSRDSRIRYVIHESRMFSSYATASRKAWAWGAYSGPSPHSDHVHLSVYRTAGAGTWNLDLGQGGGEELAHLTDAQQRQLADFIDNVYAVGSDSSVMRYMIPWFRKLSGLTPAQLAALEESQEIDALEAKLDQIIATGGAVSPHTHSATVKLT